MSPRMVVAGIVLFTGLALLALAGCVTSPIPGPTPTALPTSTPDPLAYSADPQVVVLQVVARTRGGPPESGQPCEGFVLFRVWGDGRIARIQYEQDQRHIFSGSLDPSGIHGLLVLLDEQGFFIPTTPEGPNPAGTYCNLEINLQAATYSRSRSGVPPLCTQLLTRIDALDLAPVVSEQAATGQSFDCADFPPNYPVPNPISPYPTLCSTPTSAPIGTPTPQPTWPIIVPPLVSPSVAVADIPWEPPIARTPAPTIQLAPDRYQAFVQALGPFPDFPAQPKTGELPSRAEVQTIDLLTADVNQDGQEENLWVYLIRPYYLNWPGYPVQGYLGLALFDRENHLLWLSRSAGQEKYLSEGVLRVTLETVALGSQVGVLYSEYTLTTANGAYRGQRDTLYQWNHGGMEAIWQGTIHSGGHQGAGLSGGLWAPIEFRDVDASGWPELLQQHAVTVVNFDDRPHSRHYQLYLPGALAFRWNGESFLPAYLVQDDQLTAVRPHLPLYLAPRLSVPITLDGNDEDWWQIEYRKDTALLFNNWHGAIPSFDVAWDTQYLYVTRSNLGTGSFSFALDTDLAGDLETNSLNQDDFVWSVAVSHSQDCRVTVSVLGPYPTNPSAGSYRVASARQPYAYQPCTVELAIPLDSLGLAAEDLVDGIGWVSGSLDPYDSRGYHPRAGQAIGFAMEAPEQEHSCCPYDWADPTTWSTLVFTADR